MGLHALYYNYKVIIQNLIVLGPQQFNSMTFLIDSSFDRFFLSETAEEDVAESFLA